MKKQTSRKSQRYTIRFGRDFATIFEPSGAQHSLGGPNAVDRLQSEYAAPGRTFDVLPFDTSADSRLENW